MSISKDNMINDDILNQVSTEYSDQRLEKLIIDLFDINALKFGDFKMKVGVNSPVYFDLRVIVSYPHLLDSLSTLMSELIDKKKIKCFNHICGVPYTALPIATLVSVKRQTSMVIRRKEAKDYGTRKMIEGHFKNQDECLIIEDVVTSGSSIVDTVMDLRIAGLNVSHAVVVVDREQGGVKNLKEKGIEMHVLVTMTEILKILLKAGKITDNIVSDVQKYLSNTQINIDGTFQNLDFNDEIENRLKMSFTERSKNSKNALTKKIFHLIEEKQSLLCVAADVKTSSQLLDIAKKVGPYICILKTHFDAIEDFVENTKQQLMELAKDLKFFIMEDRKFADIGNTVSLQYSSISKWADLVTAHSLPGEAMLEGLKSVRNEKENVGCFLVAELSSQGSLIDKNYIRESVKMAEKHSDIVVGLVCQTSDIIKSPNLIQLTPGIGLGIEKDNLGQCYSDPEYAVLQKGADIAVVGRGIICSSDPEKMASIYKRRLWTAYQIRIAQK